MDPANDKAPIDLSSVAAINNLDTARMALRWALERMHALETARNELAEKAEHEARMRAKSEEDYRALARSQNLRTGEENQRQLYYKKLEELVSLRLSGQLDVPTLLKREADAAQLQQILETRQVQLEKEYHAKRESLELEYQRLILESRAQSSEANRKQEDFLAHRKAGLDKEYLEKLSALKETEIRLKAAERALAERQGRFDEFCMSQRAQLESDVRSFREESDERLKFRLESSRRLLDERHEVQEDAWRQEKDVLLGELARWRRDCQDQFKRIVELETSLTEAREKGEQDLGIAQRRLIEDGRAWHDEKETLLQETQALREKLRVEAQRVLDLEKAWAMADEEARQTRSLFERQNARLQDAERGWMQKEAVLLGEIEEVRKKLSLESERLVEAERRALSVEDFCRQTQQESARLASRLEELKAAAKRVPDLEASVAQKAEALEAAAAQIRRLNERVTMLLGSLKEDDRVSVLQDGHIAELEKKLAATEEQLRVSRERADKHADLMAEKERAWLEDKAFFIEESELARGRLGEERKRAGELTHRMRALEESAAAAQQRFLEEHALLMERESVGAKRKEGFLAELAQAHAYAQTLEGRMKALEEAARSAKEESAQKDLLTDEHRKAWEAEKELLLKDLESWRRKHEDQLKHIAELEARTASTGDLLANFRAKSDTEISRRQETHRAVEKEKQAWNAELALWEKKASEAGARAFEMERRLAAAQETMERALEEAKRKEAELKTREDRLKEEFRSRKTELEALKAQFQKDLADLGGPRGIR